LKRISVLLIVVLLLSALVLPGLAYAKKPAGTPGKGPLGLGAAGKPSAAPGLASKSAGASVASTKSKKKTNFVIQGKVTDVTKTDDSVSSFKVEIMRGTGLGTLKRLADRDIIDEAKLVPPKIVEIKVRLSDKPLTKFRPKKAKLEKDSMVNVKGRIVKSDDKWILEATRVVVKPRTED
jgi:hypothetical protein